MPKKPIAMTEQQGRQMLDRMVEQIKFYAPDEIIAVARSGFSYAGWTAQILEIRDIGVYYPQRRELIKQKSSRRLVFVDDNTVHGETYLECEKFMREHYPDVDWCWAVLFCDKDTTPKEIQEQVIKGDSLDWFAYPMWGSEKVIKKLHQRTRDEDSL